MPLELTDIKADPRKLETGCWWRVWMEAGAVLNGTPIEEAQIKEDDAALLIVPIGVAYHRKLEDEREAVRAAHPKREVSEAAQRSIVAKALAATTLRGWRNLTLEGQALPWSEDKAAEILAKPEWCWLTEFVLSAAQHRSATLAKEEEGDAKN